MRRAAVDNGAETSDDIRPKRRKPRQPAVEVMLLKSWLHPDVEKDEERTG